LEAGINKTINAEGLSPVLPLTCCFPVNPVNPVKGLFRSSPPELFEAAPPGVSSRLVGVASSLKKPIKLVDLYPRKGYFCYVKPSFEVSVLKAARPLQLRKRTNGVINARRP
jgi:hypothetical protein